MVLMIMTFHIIIIIIIIVILIYYINTLDCLIQAYKDMEETPNLSLPTLGRSNDQIFFISAAQVY